MKMVPSQQQQYSEIFASININICILLFPIIFHLCALSFDFVLFGVLVVLFGILLSLLLYCP